MNRDEMLGPAVSEAGEAYEPGTGYKGYAFGGVILVAIAIKAGLMVVNRADDGSEATAPASTQLAAELQEAARLIRASAPTRLDEVTTLVGATADGNRITYQMRLDGEIPAAQLATAEASARSEVQRRVCATPPTRNLIRAGGVMSYEYTDRAGHNFRVLVNAC